MYSTIRLWTPSKHLDIDVTTEHAKRLQRIATFLSRWNGGDAKLWDYHLSHSSLQIRIEKQNVKGNLHLRCGDTIRIEAPSRWADCHITVAPCDDGGFLIVDESADVRIHVGIVDAAENVKPVY